MKKEKRTVQKLKLHRETLRDLSGSSLEMVVGGLAKRTLNTCPAECKELAPFNEDSL
jgi:hypothetical protein